MSTNVTWNGTTYAIPASGEVGWAALSNFLIALGTDAAIAQEMKQAVRVATTTPVTVSDTTDCVVLTKLAVAGAVAVTLPAGTDGRWFVIGDQTGDANTNNITITPNGAETINGSATYVINDNRGSVVLVYSVTNTRWNIVGRYIAGSVLVNPMDSAGDMIYGGTAGVATKLDSGSSGQLLMSNGAAAPGWVDTVSGAKTWNDVQTFKASSGSVSAGGYTTAGLWTLGPSAGGAIDHSVYGRSLTIDGTSARDPDLYLQYSSTAYSLDELDHGNGFSFGVDSRVFRIRGNGGSELSAGAFTPTGAWTIGTAGLTGNHTVTGATSSGGVLYVENNNATASSSARVIDARYAVDTDCTGGYFLACFNQAGSVIGRVEAASNTTVNFTGTSDERLKTNPTEFNGLDLVMQLIPREFEWISNPGKRSKGFYAQEIYTVLPDVVSVGTDDVTEGGSLASPWGIDYGKLTPVLVKAVQELACQVQELASQVSNLKSKLAEGA